MSKQGPNTYKQQMKDTKPGVLSALKRVKDKAIDVTSDILSAPKRIAEKAKEKKFAAEADNYKFVRERKGQPDAGNYTDPLFRARVSAIHDTFDREEAKKKQVGALQKVGGNTVKAGSLNK